MSGLQILALIFCISGTGAVIGAIVSNEWRVTSRASSVITATWVFQGLWMNCAGNALGSYHCRPHFTIFRVEGFLQACRALMIAAICLGFFGTIFAFAGMKCTRIGGSDQMKAKVACLAGVLFIFSGTCSLTGCSLYAHKTTSEFFDPTLVSAKYELGTALFVGWAGALLCMAGGFMFCCTLSGGITFPRPSYPYNTAASSNTSLRTKSKVATKLMSLQGSSQGYNKNSYV